MRLADFDPHYSGEYWFPGVFLHRWYLRLTSFDSVIPMDVIRVKSYVDSFLDSSSAPVSLDQ